MSQDLNFLNFFKFFFPSDKVKIDVHNTFTPANSNNINNSNTQTTTQTTTQTSTPTIADYMQNTYNITNIKTYLTNTTNYLYHEIKDFYSKNKQFILPAAIISSYAGIYLILYTGDNYIENDDLWSNWPDMQNLEELKQLDQKEIIKLLFTEIQSRYINYNKPLDFLLPFSVFIKNIEKEKNRLTFYFNFYKFLETTKLIKIFPLNTKNFLKIKSKINKLLFIRNIFFSWLSTNIIDKYSINTQPYPKP